MSAPPPDLTALVEAGLDRGRIGFGDATVPAAALAEVGRQRFGPQADGPTVAAVLTNDRPSVELILGAILTGARLVSLPLPGRAADLRAYAAEIARACASQGASEVLVRDDLAPMLVDLGVPARAHSSLDGPGARPVAAPQPGSFEVVQFSSGSTGKPKAIALHGEVVARNILSVISRVEPRPGDAIVSWLPLSHDMGLMGMLLTPIIAMAPTWIGGGDVVLLEPERFLRRPQLWPEALDRWSGTITAAPTFGYELAARQPLAHLDLRAMRCAIVGGDVVRANTVQAAVEAFAPAGFDPLALCPAYGMAELGLAAALTAPGLRWREVEIDTAALGDHQRVPARPGQRSSRLVASGTSLDGYSLVIDQTEGDIGRIDVVVPVSGHDGTTGAPLADATGRLATGDVGFLDSDGWIYVCGRGDDHFTANGRNVHAPAVEAAVNDVAGVRRGRATAVGTPTGEWVLVIEATGTPTPEATRTLVRDVRRAAVSVAASQPTEVVVLPPGLLPMTSSGKLQRHEVRRRWMNGMLESM